MADIPIITIMGAMGAILTVTFISTLISKRLYIRKLRAQGLPMPPHSFLFGHVGLAFSITRSLPSDAHPFYLSHFVRLRYPELGPEFYLDLWPFALSMLVATSPEGLNQAVTKGVLKKNVMLRNFLLPLADGLDMVSAEGAYWKKWRNAFNPGFSSAHITSLVPLIVDQVQVYCGILDERVAAQNMFAMKSLTDNLILDVIGKLVIDVHFDCQRNFNQVIHSLRTQVKWLSTGYDFNLLNRWNPARRFIHWYHGRIVDRYVANALDQRIADYQTNPNEHKSNRTITSLALSTYTNEDSASTKALLDSQFKKQCIAQIKIFLFAGHDTTSSGTCFCLWDLVQHPHVLARTREEHTRVFGSDPTQAIEAIKIKPHLLSQLPYTTAVIKESLRLHPTVTTTREGHPDVNIIDAQGRVLPTEGMIVWPNQQHCHRDPDFWPQAEEFIPERWLVGPEDPLYPPKGMFRPFEQGPRNCVGQELAMLEMKIVLVMVSRTYVIKPGYEEIDARQGRTTRTVLGTQAYAVDAMQPRLDLPVRVEYLEKANRVLGKD